MRFSCPFFSFCSISFSCFVERFIWSGQLYFHLICVCVSLRIIYICFCRSFVCTFVTPPRKIVREWLCVHWIPIHINSDSFVLNSTSESTAITYCTSSVGTPTRGRNGHGSPRNPCPPRHILPISILKPDQQSRYHDHGITNAQFSHRYLTPPLSPPLLQLPLPNSNLKCYTDKLNQ